MVTLGSYGRLCTEFYDLDKPEPPLAELERYARYAARAEGPVHEAMCGSGRFLLSLLARGFDLDGSDSSPQMLAACRTRATARGLDPVLYEQPLQTLALPRRYRLILIPGGSFSLLTDPDHVRAALSRLHDRLVPGGTLLLEVMRFQEQPTLTNTVGERWARRVDGSSLRFQWRDSYLAGERVSTHHHRYDVLREGHLLETECEVIRLRAYEPGELIALLHDSGFDAQQAPDDGTPEQERGERDLVLECVKPLTKFPS
jgi:trans-aconitate methyltransferase